MERERADCRERETQDEAEHEAVAEAADGQQPLAPRGRGRAERARRARVDGVPEWTPPLPQLVTAEIHGSNCHRFWASQVNAAVPESPWAALLLGSVTTNL